MIAAQLCYACVMISELSSVHLWKNDLGNRSSVFRHSPEASLCIDSIGRVTLVNIFMLVSLVGLFHIHATHWGSFVAFSSVQGYSNQQNDSHNLPALISAHYAMKLCGL